MSLSVNRISNINFKSKKTSSQKNNNVSAKTDKTKNPISKGGERAQLVLGTFMAGIGFGGRMLAELLDGDFAIEHLFGAGKKVADKNFKKASPNKRFIAGLGASIGLVGLFIAGMAVLYTAFKAPKIAYDAKVNTFTKSKDMDVYIKGNEIEKDLYTQMNDKAKNATDEEKTKLKEQYLTMQMAKNRVPDFVNL